MSEATTSLNGVELFMWLVRHYNMDMKDAVETMIERGQDTDWLDAMNSGALNAVMTNDKDMTAFIRSNV